MCIDKYLKDPIKLAKLLAKAMKMVHFEKDGKVLILYGDVPIIRPETLRNLIKNVCKECQNI